MCIFVQTLTKNVNVSKLAKKSDRKWFNKITVFIYQKNL